MDYMTVDLQIFAAWVTTIGALATPLWVLIKAVNKLLKRLSHLESWTTKQQVDIEHSQRERTILLQGTLACLKGLREQGCNGAVSKSIIDIEAFLMEEAHRGKSVLEKAG